MSLDEIARRDMARIADRQKFVAAFQNASSLHSFALIEAARAMASEREEAFKRVRELEEEVEKTRLALDEYDQAAMQRSWPA